MKLACSTIFVCFNYSSSFSSDDFSSFKNSAKEARLLRNDILSLKINRPDSRIFTCCIKTKVRVVKVRHNLLHIVLQGISVKHNH